MTDEEHIIWERLRQCFYYPLCRGRDSGKKGKLLAQNRPEQNEADQSKLASLNSLFHQAPPHRTFVYEGGQGEPTWIFYVLVTQHLAKVLGCFHPVVAIQSK
jgi:hypothetical protein